MKSSHPFDIAIHLVPAQMLTTVVAILAVGGFFYLLVNQPLWIGLPAGIAVLAFGAWLLFVILDRVDGDKRSRH